MKTKIQIGIEIRKQLNAQQRSISWLADNIGCDQSNLCKRLNKPHINTDLLYKISSSLGIDFFALYTNSLSDSSLNEYQIRKNLP